MTPPLAGLAVRIGAGADPHGYSALLFRRLGASVSVVPGREVRIGGGGALLDGVPPEVEPGLPAGVVPLATGAAVVLGALAGFLAGEIVTVPVVAIRAHVFLPFVVAASFRATPPPVRAPRPVGGGFVDDATTDDDAETFSRLLALLGDADAELVASRAQEWRLPVAPYRRPHPLPLLPFFPGGGAGIPDWGRVDGCRRGAAPLSGILVVDFTALWAGPLATELLAALGARVVKIEPSARLDGFRAVSGGGIYPDDVFEEGRTDRSGWFNALNRGKTRADLDARTRLDGIVDLVASADVLVESFSRRVMGNLGLGRDRLAAVRPDLVSVSVPAFSGPEEHWVALGTGVHAASGLGWTPAGSAAPAVAYPDPVAGLTAAAAAVAAVAAREAGWRPCPAEVPLDQAVASLTGRPRLFPGADPDLGPALLAAAPTDAVVDGAGAVRYPSPPFTGSAFPVPLGPAPP